MSHLVLEGVSKDYAVNGTRRAALCDVSLALERGEFVALVGPSGCGKSTLLEIVAGLTPPSAGRVLLDGRPVRRWGPDRVLLTQRPGLYPWLSAVENVAFGLRMAGCGEAERGRRALEMLAQMGLAEHAGHLPHELSGGMQQRVALARALVLDPAALLMDEPLAALDALLRARLQDEIHRRCAGRTVLLVTHSIREALTLADRVVLLTPAPGRIRAERIPPGEAPRPRTPALLALEEEIEETLSDVPGGPPP